MPDLNAWGLYDMAGNLYEWVHDWYQPSLGTGAVSDPWGAASGIQRSLRSGAVNYPAGAQRAASRAKIEPSYSSNSLGFRCARSTP